MLNCLIFIHHYLFCINSSLHCDPSRASHLYTVKYIRAKPYLDDGYSMKWPRAITLVIVLKRSLKEGNGSTNCRAVETRESKVRQSRKQIMMSF